MSNQSYAIINSSISNDKEREFFDKNGYLGPFSLTDTSSVEKLRETVANSSAIAQRLMSTRSIHIVSKPIFKVATDISILDRVSNLLGPNLLLWMGQVLVRNSGSSYVTWHIDELNYAVNGVHLSMAISDMNIRNGCLQIIPGTQNYKDNLAEYAKKGECDRYSAESMVQLADRLHPENAPHQIVSLEMKPGEYFFTKGGLWHGVTKNQTQEQRIALVARYMRPEVNSKEIEKYDGGNPNKPAIRQGKSLPCILVRGKDNYKLNTLYQPPITKFPIIFNSFGLIWIFLNTMISRIKSSKS